MIRKLMIGVLTVTLISACGDGDDQNNASDEKRAPEKVESSSKPETPKIYGQAFLDWDNTEFIECSVTTTNFMAFLISGNHDTGRVPAYSKQLSDIREAKQITGVLTESQFNSLYQSISSSVGPDQIAPRNRQAGKITDFYVYCVRKIDDLNQTVIKEQGPPPKKKKN